MSTQNNDAAADLLIREVDEELKQEQLQALWKKHGSLLVAGATALVLGVAGWQAWNAWDMKQRAATGGQFSAAMQALQQGSREDAVAQLGKVAAEGTAGYQVLADFKLADLKLASGDRDGAVALFERVAAGRGDEVYRDLARLKAAYLKLDTAEPSALEAEVAPLVAESSPWRHSAREIQALAALKRGDAARAADLYGKIADDPAAPQGLRARAAEMLAAAGPKAKG